MAIEVKEGREYLFTEKDFNKLRKVANAYSGITVSDDKYDMYYARLVKRIRFLGLDSFADYCKYLEENHDAEFTEFINSITTNLTAFFRENHHFDYLRETIIPEVYTNNAIERRIRIWSAGCSTGEEPYSIAITLQEHMDLASWDAVILATDIDSNVLNNGSSGIYDEQRVSSIPNAIKHRWFQRGKGQRSNKVRVRPDLREMITFKQLNLMHEWPIKKQFDVIFCRNVIIYFDNPTKTMLFDRFADLIVDGGHLILGHSESIHSMSDRFEAIGRTIYRKKF